MNRLSPRTLAIIAAVAVAVAVVLAILLFTQRSNPDRLGPDNRVAEQRQASPEERCASQRTYDAIKRELFRQAADTRGSDQQVYDRLAAYAVVRMDQPVMRSHDEGTGAIRCAGRMALDLPPGVAAVGGRTSLAAAVEYVIQPAADGTGDVIILQGAESIVIPLATLVRTGQPRQQQPAPLPAPVQDLPDSPPPAADTDPAPAPAPDPQPAPEPAAASANPSFNCRNARTRGEIMVCNSQSLAALDRQMAAQFTNAMAAGNSQQRDLLQRTRASFLSFRDQCPSEACVAETYRGRMREINDIMRGRWRPPRR